MSQKSFEEFRQAVLQDLALQEKLREPADYPSFIPLAIELGAKRGFVFTAAEIENARRASQKAWIERWI